MLKTLIANQPKEPKPSAGWHDESVSPKQLVAARLGFSRSVEASKCARTPLYRRAASDWTEVTATRQL